MGKGDGKRSTRGERFKKAFSHSAHLLRARQVLNCKGMECAGVNIGNLPLVDFAIYWTNKIANEDRQSFCIIIMLTD